jgi:hypothetical protein
MIALVNTQTKQLIAIRTAQFPVKPPLAWVTAPDMATDATHTYDGAAVVAKPVVVLTSWFVLKTTIRTRLRAAGLETVSNTAWPNLPASTQMAWNDAVVIHNDDPNVIAFLVSIKADPAAILAVDPDAKAFFGARA